MELSLVQNTEDRTKWEVTIPGSVFAAGVDSVAVKVNARDAKNNYSEESCNIRVLDEPQVESVTPARNAITGDNKKPLISITCTNIGTAPTAKLTLKKGTEVVLEQVAMEP